MMSPIGVFILTIAESIDPMAGTEMTYEPGASFAELSHAPVASRFDVGNSVVAGRRRGDLMAMRRFVTRWSITFSRRNLIKAQDCGAGAFWPFGNVCSIRRLQEEGKAAAKKRLRHISTSNFKRSSIICGVCS